MQKDNVVSWYSPKYITVDNQCALGEQPRNKNSPSLKNPDNHKTGNLDELIVVRVTTGHHTELRTWNLISQTSLWCLMSLPQKYQLWSESGFVRKLFQLSTHIPTSLFAILTVNNLSIISVCFLNFYWRADIVIKLLKGVFPKCQIGQKRE